MRGPGQVGPLWPVQRGGGRGRREKGSGVHSGPQEVTDFG